MGSSMTATFAYGLNLGTEEAPLVGPKDPEYGGLSDEWLDAHGMNDDDPEREWPDVLEGAILTASGFAEPEPQLADVMERREMGGNARSEWYDRKRQALAEFGVELKWTGGTSSSGLVLAIEETVNEVEWTEVFRVDPRELLTREAAGQVAAWGQKLNKILEAAGLTPDEDNAPGWLVWAECSGDH